MINHLFFFLLKCVQTDGALETALHVSVDPRNTERVHVTHLVHHAVNAAASRKSLLNRLGRSIDVLKSIMTVGEIIGSVSFHLYSSRTKWLYNQMYSYTHPLGLWSSASPLL